VPDPDLVPGWVRSRDDALEPAILHGARHTFASLLIAAGVNIKAVSTFMGHASVTITLDRYSHLLPGGPAARTWRPTCSTRSCRRTA
jgi:integrase